MFTLTPTEVHAAELAMSGVRVAQYAEVIDYLLAVTLVIWFFGVFVALAYSVHHRHLALGEALGLFALALGVFVSVAALLS